MSTEVKGMFDMQRTIMVHLIDDDDNIASELNQRFPSVFFKSFNIDTFVRRISRERGGIFEKTDLIFIDTFYKDDKSDYYALDFFEDYRAIDSETQRETQGKYFVLVGIDDINERLNRQTSQDIDVVDERTRLMALMGKVSRHPYIEWGTKKGSKIDKITDVIEQYAQKNKIYLYKNKEISFDEWINYIISLIHKTEALINDIQGVQGEKSGIASIIDGLSDIIVRARKKIKLDSDDLEDNYGDIKTIEDAINFTEEYNRALSELIDNLMTVGVECLNYKLMDLAHHFSNLILDSSGRIERQRRIMKNGKNR